MVIGNFALLAGLDPQALHRWYLGIYIDAFQWIEMPNIVGVSQFADGGLVARMSDARREPLAERAAQVLADLHGL